MVKRVAVFTGSSVGSDPIYMSAARSLARLLVRNRISIIFGGFSTGTMGALAQTAGELNGDITGIIPEDLISMGMPHDRVNKLIKVSSVAERKQRMFELSDAAIALPGGLGTLDEAVHYLLMAKLHSHNKPCGFLNVNGFFTHLEFFFQHVATQNFIKTEHRNLFAFDKDPRCLLKKLSLNKT